MTSSSSPSTFDLIVIGAGAVGENVADYAHKRGLSVAVVEAELVGGECSYWACMPSKALLRSAEALDAARTVDGAAQAVTGDLDVAAVLARRDSFTSNWDDGGQVAWLEGAGITLVRGHARFTGPKQLAVTTEDGTVTHLEASAICVSTGSEAVVPDIRGIHEIEVWTSREATSVQQVPASVAILGGGVVATEMATAYTALGAQVTVIVRGAGLLAGNEPFAGEAVLAALREGGATVHLETGLDAVSPSSVGAHLELSTGEGLDVERLIVATGRRAHTRDLGLETIGLEPGAWLDVDDTMLVTGTDWLYATGDANHRALLTHQGKYQARAAGEAIAARLQGTAVDDAAWGAHVATADHAAVPQVTFTNPEVASIGLTAAQADEQGIRIRVVDYDLGAIAGSSLHRDGYAGQARMVVDEERQVIVGVTFVGPDVAELLHAATIAVVGEVPIARLWHAVPAYPTMNEIWLRLLETYGRA